MLNFKNKCTKRNLFIFCAVILTVSTKPNIASAAETYLDFNKIVKEGRGSIGIDVRGDGKIVNYKNGDWFCIDIGSSLGENAKMRIKLKRKESRSGNIQVTRLEANGTVLGNINTSNISKRSYNWTSKVNLGRTSQKVLCFVNKGPRIQIEKIGLERSGSNGGGSTGGNDSLSDYLKGLRKYDKGQKINKTKLISYNGRSVRYTVVGGVIRKPSKRPSYAEIPTNISNNQTQIVSLGTSDGGSRSKDKDKPVNKTLMEKQGFTLIATTGPRDGRSEVWARDYKSSSHSKNVYISGDSNAVAWTVYSLQADISVSELKNRAKDSSSGRKVTGSNGNYKLAIPLRPSTSNKLKFVSMFLDDTTDITDSNSHIESFSGQGDGDTYFSGLWGSERVPTEIRVNPKEDKSFDAAVVTTYIK